MTLPKVYTAQEISECFDVSYTTALRDLQESGLAWQVGRRWFLYDAYFDDFAVWAEGRGRVLV